MVETEIKYNTINPDLSFPWFGTGTSMKPI